MLKYFREHRRGYPIELLREYLSAHRDELNMTYDEFRVWPAGKMLMYGKEASNRKQEIDRQHYTIPNQRPKDKHCGKI